MTNLNDTSGAKRPPRVLERPDIDAWSPWEPINLEECAALYFPRGPLTVRSLRTAARDGVLKTVRIAGKIFTSKGAIMEMTKHDNWDPSPPRRERKAADEHDPKPRPECRPLSKESESLLLKLKEERAKLRPRRTPRS